MQQISELEKHTQLEIPISVAREIANNYNYSEVVIYAYNKHTNVEHITTFGKSKSDCWEACLTGNKIKTMLGWPEEFCNTEPDMANKIEE